MARPRANAISLDKKEYQAVLKEIRQIAKRVTPEAAERVQKKALRPMTSAMRANAPSDRFKKQIGVTASKKYTFLGSVRVGVVKNNASLFPEISAQGLAAIIEYGTGERFRREGKFTAVSTGEMTAAPFVRPAYDANIGAALRNIEADLIAGAEGKKQI